MELSLDPSFSGSVQRFREEEADTFGNGSTKHSLTTAGNSKSNDANTHLTFDSKLPKSPATSYNQQNGASEKLTLLAKENKAMEERIDSMLKDKEKLEISNTNLLKELSKVNQAL